MITNENPRVFSSNDLAQLAVEDIAYVKSVEIDGEALYAIHAADGTQLGFAAERDAAFATVLLHDLTPVSVH